MLKKLKTHKLVDEQDRIKYASGSLSLTIWFDANAEIFAFEVIFDLLMNEKCFFYSRKSGVRYSEILDDNLKFGRTKKQVISNKIIEFDKTKFYEFSDEANLIHPKYKKFILSVMEDSFKD